MLFNFRDIAFDHAFHGHVTDFRQRKSHVGPTDRIASWQMDTNQMSPAIASFPDSTIARMEMELNALKKEYVSRLRELSGMASLRETIAASLLNRESNSPNEYSGPGYSPGGTNFSSHSPPHGAEVWHPYFVSMIHLSAVLSILPAGSEPKQTQSMDCKESVARTK